MFDLDVLQNRAAALSSKQIFFVCGAAKSGTTWTRLLLDAHPQVVCLSEGHFANRLLPALEHALRGHNRQIAHKNQVVFREISPFPLFRSDHARYLLIAAITLILGEPAADPSVLAIGEKTPDNVRYLPVLASAFPRARFIHVVRDGRDCAVSCWFHNRRLGREWMDKNFPKFDTFAEQYARIWALAMRQGRVFADRAPERYLELRYEDMSADTARAAEAMFRFLGVTTQPDVVARCCEAAAFETASGGRRRGEEDAQSFFRKGLSGDWREHMDEDAVRRFALATDGWLARMGYAV